MDQDHPTLQLHMMRNHEISLEKYYEQHVEKAEIPEKIPEEIPQKSPSTKIDTQGAESLYSKAEVAKGKSLRAEDPLAFEDWIDQCTYLCKWDQFEAGSIREFRTHFTNQHNQTYEEHRRVVGPTFSQKARWVIFEFCGLFHCLS